LRHVEVADDDGNTRLVPPTVTIDYNRDGERRTLRGVQTTFNEERQTFLLGFLPDARRAFFSSTTEDNEMIQRAGFGESLYNSIHDISHYVRATLMGISRLFTGRISIDDVGGPVMIVGAISETTEASMEHGGISAVAWNAVWWAMLISSNLFVFNLLPIPALDGGKMVFLTIEAIRKKPIKPEVEGIIHFVGFILLMAFAAFMIFNDTMRLFG